MMNKAASHVTPDFQDIHQQLQAFQPQRPAIVQFRSRLSALRSNLARPNTIGVTQDDRPRSHQLAERVCDVQQYFHHKLNYKLKLPVAFFHGDDALSELSKKMLLSLPREERSRLLTSNDGYDAVIKAIQRHPRYNSLYQALQHAERLRSRHEAAVYFPLEREHFIYIHRDNTWAQDHMLLAHELVHVFQFDQDLTNTGEIALVEGQAIYASWLWSQEQQHPYIKRVALEDMFDQVDRLLRVLTKPSTEVLSPNHTLGLAVAIAIASNHGDEMIFKTERFFELGAILFQANAR